MVTLEKQCFVCGKIHEYSFDIQPSQYTDWLGGVLIQNAMPELEPDEREIMMTGICYSCQSEVFQ